MQKRNCEYCEKEFIPKKKCQKGIYCSRSCSGKGSTKIRDELRNLPPLLSRPCAECFKDFMPRERSQPGKFCSKSCHMKVKRKIFIDKRKEFLLAETVEDRKIRLIERYERFVIKNGEFCWDWDGSKSSGYGCMMFDGKSMKAHRVSFEIHNGPIPKGMFICHFCDVKDCSNPKHLFLGTNTDNMRDMINKGRAVYPNGSKHHNSILTEEKVGRIKTLLKKGMRLASIAREYKVSAGAIDGIKNGRNWKSVKSS